MHGRGETEINDAIQQCAKQCMAEADARICAGTFAIALIASGWKADDAREVLTGSLAVLAKLTGDDSLVA